MITGIHVSMYVYIIHELILTCCPTAQLFGGLTDWTENLINQKVVHDYKRFK